MTERWTHAQVEAMGADKGFLPAEHWPLRRGEAPIASHLLYTQPGILRDEIPEERQWGIDAGLAWRGVAELAAFYVDRGWSSGMVAARDIYERDGRPFEMRFLSDSDGTATAAANGVLPVPKDCQARAEGIAQDSPDE